MSEGWRDDSHLPRLAATTAATFLLLAFLVFAFLLPAFLVLASLLVPTTSPATSLLPTAPAAAGGGQINTSISTLLNGVTDIDYKTFGTINDVARLDYVAVGSTMTITIGGQTGTFDLSNRVPGIYKSTGTLAGMEITLASSFDFTTNISSATQTNTVAETDRIGAEPSNFSLATDLTGVTSRSLNASANDNVLTLASDKSTGVLTVTDATASASGTVTIGTTGGTGTKDYTVASGALAGTIVTIDTNTFDYGTTFDNTTNANGETKSGGNSSRTLTSVTTVIDGGAVRELNKTAATDFVFTITQVAGTDDTIALDSGPAGWSVTSPSTTGDLSGADVTLTFTKGGESFTAQVITSGNVVDGETFQVTLPLNELKNKIAADSDDLVVTVATAPVLSNWGAGDLAALIVTADAAIDAVKVVVDAITAAGPTKTEMDTGQGLLATEAKQAVIDGIIDSILIDTGDMPPRVAAIEIDTGTTLDGRIPAALVGGRMDSNTGAISGDATAADRLEAAMDGVVIGTVVTAGTTTTNIVSDLSEATDDHFNGQLMTIIDGPLVGQTVEVTDYAGGTKAFTVSAATEAPTNSDRFIVH